LNPFLDAGLLIRDLRRRHGLTQHALARLAGTSQTQLSRIERCTVSPSVATVARLLAAVGERLELVASPAPGPGIPGYVPDHDAERRMDAAVGTPASRVLEAIALSRTATGVAAAARTARADA
jgi:transcriptional regulator with XRE-family HTH domain